MRLLYHAWSRVSIKIQIAFESPFYSHIDHFIRESLAKNLNILCISCFLLLWLQRRRVPKKNERHILILSEFKHAVAKAAAIDAKIKRRSYFHEKHIKKMRP